MNTLKELLSSWPVIVALGLLVVFVLGYLTGRKKEHEKHERSKKIQRSVLGGLFSEQIAPFLPGFPEELRASEARFIGKPIDFLIFKGMDEQNIEEVVFVEVKTGKAQLNAQERKLREVIEQKKVRWCEYRIDTTVS
jgi:predicted Holliday junction resolvase-like endonuclease